MIAALRARGSLLAFAASCVLAAAAPGLDAFARSEGPSLPFPGWSKIVPAGFRQLPLSAQERRFAADFPGRLARFSNGRQQLVARWIATPSRSLHPAEHCLRGVGFELRPGVRGSMAARPGAATWIAERAGRRLRVTEWIEASDGRTFASVSEWYWASALGRSRGPWVAYTLSEPVGIGMRPTHNER